MDDYKSCAWYQNGTCIRDDKSSAPIECADCEDYERRVVYKMEDLQKMSEPRCVLCIHYDMQTDICTCNAVCKDYSKLKMKDAMANHIKESEIYDAVNHDHYKHGGIKCIGCIKAALGENFMGFLIGNVIEYTYRYKDKNGVEDLEKALWYLGRAIKEFENDKVE